MEIEVDSAVETLSSWVNSLLANLPNILVAILIVAVAWVVARFVARGVQSVLERSTQRHTLAGLVATVTRFLVIGLGLVLALNVLHLEKAVTTVLAGAGIVGLALGFAFQDLSANLISGVGLTMKRPIRRGDLIKTNDVLGIVEEIDLRTTLMKTLDGESVRVPNRLIYESVLTNYTMTDERRVRLSCGVAYGDDLPTARQTVVSAIEGLPGTERHQFIWTGFGDSSIDFEVRFWIQESDQASFLEAKSGAVEAIKSALDDAGLTIPFPIRTLDFGADVVGGEKLRGELVHLTKPATQAEGRNGARPD